jgi:hypothetical protein
MFTNFNGNIEEQGKLHLRCRLMSIFHWKSHQVAFMIIGRQTPPTDPVPLPPNCIHPPDYCDPQQLVTFVNNMIEDLLRVEDPITHAMPAARNSEGAFQFFRGYLRQLLPPVAQVPPPPVVIVPPPPVAIVPPPYADFLVH